MSLRTQMFKILIRNNVICDAVEERNELTKYFHDLFVVYKECCFLTRR